MNETFERDGLVVRVKHQDGHVEVAYEGTSDARDPQQFLGPIMKKVIESSKDKSSVKIDLSTLKYMNSASVGPLITLMKELAQSGIAAVFLWDTKVNWQRANFLCMKTLSKTMTNIAIETR